MIVFFITKFFSLQIFLYTLIITLPSSNHQKIKIRTKKAPNPVVEKGELLNEELSTSTEIFKNEINDKIHESKAIFGSFMNSSSPNSLKLYNAQSSNNNDHLFHIFGSKPVFENPLNVSFFKMKNHRKSSNDSKNDLSESLNSSNCSDNLNESYQIGCENTGNKSPELELNKCLSDLHLSSYSSEKRRNNGELPAAFRVSSPLLRPKPVLSPPKLQNVTQASWVAGGYWKPNEYLNNFNGFSNLSRSSSQSSGFSSQASSQPFHCDNVFNSLPSSRTNSVCGEFDRYSVFSEPAYQYNKTSPTSSHFSAKSRFYPDLRDQQIYICPKPMNVYVQKSDKLHENFCGNVFAMPSSSRPPSRESMFTPTNLNSSFSSCSSSFQGNNTTLRPSSVNSSFYSEPFTKGTLLQKWREQIPNIQNL